MTSPARPDTAASAGRPAAPAAVGPSAPVDLIVIGAGILGLATAHRALDDGLTVRVIEQETRPIGASIQNFGHACFTAQADDLQGLAMDSRDGWLRAAERTGIPTWGPGTLIPAATEAELRVLSEFAVHRGAEQVRLLTVEQIRGALGTSAPLVGGAHLPLDMRVDPRRTVGRLADAIEERGGILHRRERVLRVADGAVETTRGTHRAERVIACPGAGIDGLFPEIAERAGVTRCTLAMTLLERPDHLPVDLAMLTGTSLTRYDGFTAMPGADALRRELAEREPELMACRANLMATAIDEGVLIGDSHAYDTAPEPFVDTSLTGLLVGRASALLGIERPRPLQHWLGQYSDAPDTNLLVEDVDEATTVAVVTSGIGMTLSFGIARRLLDRAPLSSASPATAA